MSMRRAVVKSSWVVAPLLGEVSLTRRSCFGEDYGGAWEMEGGSVFGMIGG